MKLPEECKYWHRSYIQLYKNIFDWLESLNLIKENAIIKFGEEDKTILYVESSIPYNNATLKLNDGELYMAEEDNKVYWIVWFD